MFYKFATDLSLWEHAIYIFMTLSRKIKDFEIIFIVHVCTKPKKKNCMKIHASVNTYISIFLEIQFINVMRMRE